MFPYQDKNKLEFKHIHKLFLLPTTDTIHFLNGGHKFFSYDVDLGGWREEVNTGILIVFRETDGLGSG